MLLLLVLLLLPQLFEVVALLLNSLSEKLKNHYYFLNNFIGKYRKRFYDAIIALLLKTQDDYDKLLRCSSFNSGDFC